MKKIKGNSLVTYFFYAFVAMSGLAYINFLPGVVNTLVTGFGFSEAQAGHIVAINGYGGLVGSILAIFWVQKLHWKPSIIVLLLILTALDTITAWIANYHLILSVRLIAGILGGLSVGLTIAVLARLKNPERAFGALLFVQFGIGSLVIYLLPGMEERFSLNVVFYVMAGFMVLSLFFIGFLPKISSSKPSNTQSVRLSVSFKAALLLLLSIALYQIAASAIWAYVGLIGIEANIDAESVNVFIASTGLLGLLGALFPMVNGDKFGRFYCLLTGLLFSVLAAVLMLFAQFYSLYIVSMALLFFSWPAVQSYLLAVTADMDSSGKLSTIASMVSFTGLATGPLMASSLLTNGNYSSMLYACALVFLLSLILLIKPVQILDKNEGVALTY